MNCRPFLLVVALGSLNACVAPPYYGRAVVKDRQGQLVCGLHGSPLKVKKVYFFNGFITGTPDYEFAARRYPNVRSVGFSEELDKGRSTVPGTEYICAECQKAHKRLERFPMWYKQLTGKSAERRREQQLQRAAEKAKRTGNPLDARLPDGDGFISRILE